MIVNDTTNWTQADWDRNYQIRLNTNLANARFLVVIDRYFDKAPDGPVGLTFVYNQDGENQPSIANGVLGGGLMSIEEANTLRRTLFNGATQWAFADLDTDTQYYITHNLAPLEWHVKLDANDQEYMDHTMVWSIDKPTVPAKPVPPTLTETIITGLGAVFLAGLFGSAEEVVPPPVLVHTSVSKVDLAAFVSVTLRELPFDSDNWDLRNALDRIRTDLRRDNLTHAVFAVKEMSFSSNPAMALWAKRCMPAVGIS